MSNRLFFDISYNSRNYAGENICGDNFLWKKNTRGNRMVAVLSDGMGHGVKANILSTFTSTMMLNFTSAHEELTNTADMIMRMLPVCNIRKVSYATFGILDIDLATGEATIAQYDNPPAFIIRKGKVIEPHWETREIVREGMRTMQLRTATFNVEENDRIIMVTDGITQSGQKEGLYKFGWGDSQLRQFASYTLSINPGINSQDLAAQIVSKAAINDAGRPSDDMSCMVVNFRTPRRMMLVSCPPSLSQYHKELSDLISSFDGIKVVCGHPVARIIAEESGMPLEKNAKSMDPLHEAVYRLPGFDLVTEGIIVPNRLLDIMEGKEDTANDTSLAGKLLKTLLHNDELEFIIGMRRVLDAGPGNPDVYELRRNTLRRIIKLLETKYGKKVNVRYL